MSLSCVLLGVRAYAAQRPSIFMCCPCSAASVNNTNICNDQLSFTSTHGHVQDLLMFLAGFLLHSITSLSHCGEKKHKSAPPHITRTYRCIRAQAVHRWCHLQAIGTDTCGEYSRARGWLLNRLNIFGQQQTRSCSPADTAERTALPEGASPWQAGCPELIPGGHNFKSSDVLLHPRVVT